MLVLGTVRRKLTALVGFSEQLGFSNHDFPLNLVSDTYANGLGVWVGGIAFAGAIAVLYVWVSRMSRSVAAS